MTIKEAEARTGLARANIRYYEEQGFFSAGRGENGYRNYSEENIDILLKIKLLRQLGFSLEDIRALQNGEQRLNSALERREAGLERESRELSRAAQLCRELRTDGADFYTLDARLYLNRLERTEEVLSQDRDPERIFPWRRYFARTLDLELYTALLAVVLQLALRVNLIRLMEQSGGTFLLSLGALALMAGAETVMLHLWGTTPGKALLGLKILREDGSRLSWEESARRTGNVTAFFGGGLLLSQIPILIFALAGLGMDIWACWRVYHGKPLFWEGDQLYLDGSTRERSFWDNRRSFLRAGGYLAAFAACIGLMIGGHLLAAMPPHRGAELTVEEFVENYNQYASFVNGAEHLTHRLALDGSFEEVPREDNTFIISIMGNEDLPKPSFQFVQDGDCLERVTLVRCFQSSEPLVENSSYFVSVPYEEIYTALRSLLYGRLGDRRINALYEELVEADGNFHSIQDGVKIDSEMRFSGFHSFDGSTLLAKSGQAQTYLVEFTVSLAA